MAYREETEQQFMESIARQMAMPFSKRPARGRLPSGFQNLDNDTQMPDPDDEFTDHLYGNELKPPQMGGYSSDVGAHPSAPAPSGEGNEGLQARIEMRKVKSEIDRTEKRLHELQQQKVDLMRKITGRL